MSIVVNKNNGLDITLGKGHLHRSIVTVLPVGSDTGLDGAISAGVALDIRRGEALDMAVCWRLLNATTSSSTLINTTYPDTPHTSMGPDFNNESSNNSNKNEELHGQLRYHGDQDQCPLTYSTCSENLEVSTCSSRG